MKIIHKAAIYLGAATMLVAALTAACAMLGCRGLLWGLGLELILLAGLLVIADMTREDD